LNPKDFLDMRKKGEMKCACALFGLIEFIWLNKLFGLNSLEAGRLFCRTRIFADSTNI